LHAVPPVPQLLSEVPGRQTTPRNGSQQPLAQLEGSQLPPLPPPVPPLPPPLPELVTQEPAWQTWPEGQPMQATPPWPQLLDVGGSTQVEPLQHPAPQLFESQVELCWHWPFTQL
jgi:hypothetical protein